MFMKMWMLGQERSHLKLLDPFGIPEMIGDDQLHWALSRAQLLCSNAACVHPQRMGILNVGQRIEEQAEFEKIYKNGTAMCHMC